MSDHLVLSASCWEECQAGDLMQRLADVTRERDEARQLVIDLHERGVADLAVLRAVESWEDVDK